MKTWVDFMGNAPLSEDEKKKLVKDVEKSLDTIFKNKPYAVSITVMEEYEQKENRVLAGCWAINRIGNVNLMNAAFPKISTLMQAFSMNAQKFIQDIYKGNPQSGVNEGRDSH